jgi:coenzyme F420-0:L-glutamate ligase/coenzyme F420-1:gamma-L-glutamate ligase
MAAAGVDVSNVAPGRVLLLPDDPDRAARDLRREIGRRVGINVAVVVSDTAGRPWREGQTDIAIGAAGLQVLDDHSGRVDPYGNVLAVTAPAVADELSGAAELAAGKLGRRPFVVVRGRGDLVLAPDDDGPGAAALLRPEAADLFGFGARDAVVAALRGSADDRAAYGAPAEATDLRDLLVALTGAEVALDGERLVVSGTDRRARWVAEVAAYAHGWTTEVIDRDVLRLAPSPSRGARG